MSNYTVVLVDVKSEEKRLFQISHEEVAAYFNSGMGPCYTVNGRSWGIISSLVCPVRTNSFENLCEDVFLPTLIHRALRIENSALKAFTALGAFILDVMTLPFRCITLIPRAIYNGMQKEHLLLELIQKKQISNFSPEVCYAFLAWDHTRTLNTVEEVLTADRSCKEPGVFFVRSVPYAVDDERALGNRFGLSY